LYLQPPVKLSGAIFRILLTQNRFGFFAGQFCPRLWGICPHTPNFSHGPANGAVAGTAHSRQLSQLKRLKIFQIFEISCDCRFRAPTLRREYNHSV
jgi:hypothetical protein